jgi:nucleoid-associated protein YgaU
MSQKLIIQVLVLLGLAGAGAAGYYLSQKGDGPAQTTEAPKAGDAASQTAETDTPAKTESPKASETPQETADIGGKSVEERLAAVPSFDLMRVEPDGSAVVAGRSEAGAIIALLANGEVIGRGIANAAGEFAIVLDQPLKPGAHAVTLETRDAEGKVLNESEQSMAVSVPDDPSKGEVLVMLNEPGAPSQILQKPQQVADAGTAGDTEPAPQQTAATEAPAQTPDASANADTAASQTVADAKPQPAGEQPAPTAEAQTEPQPEPQAAPQTAGTSDTTTEQQVAAAPQAGGTGAAPASSDQPAATGGNAPSDTVPAADAATPTVTVEAVETEDEKVFVAGSGEPNSDVRVYLDNQLVGEAKTDAKGRWLLETQGEVKPGEVSVRADQVTTGDGAVTARAEVTFEKSAEEAVILRPVALSGEAGAGSGASGDAGTRQIPSVIIRTGDNLWTISQRRYGEGVRYTTIYQANKDQIRNPDLIYPGQVFMIPEGDRNWPAPRATGG